MKTITTISELLTLSNSHYRIFDIGRKIDALSKEEFNDIELNYLPYPYPSQGHAFFAIVFWDERSQHPYIWFVKLPLDERGLLNQAARDHYVTIIVEALGNDLSISPTEQQADILKANPYHFTPSQYKLAAINSKIKVELKQEGSSYLQPYQAYLSDRRSLNKWQDIGIQGITDFAARINQQNNTTLLISALPYLPQEVLYPLCTGLENETLNIELVNQILSMLENADTKIDYLALQQHLLRSLASSSDEPSVIEFISRLLQKKSLESDILITMAGRCWLLLNTEELLMKYLEQLAHCTEQQLFNAIFKDLVAIPTIRPILFNCIRNTNRSDNLSQAIGRLFNTSS